MELLQETEIVREAIKGDIEAFSILVRKYSNAASATALQYVKDYYHAQDIAQEAFIRMWHHRHQIKETDKVGKWLYTTTKRLSIDWIRKCNNRPASSPYEEIEVPDTQNTEDHVIRNERKRIVWDAMGRLKEHDRTVILMYYVSGFNTREIAGFLGVSVNTIESRLRRTREKLKEELFQLVGDVFMHEISTKADANNITTINLSFALGSAYIDLFNEHVVRRFEKENPHIQVRVTSYDLCEFPDLDYEEELIRMIAGGNQPDVALFNPAYMASWVDKDLLHPITSRIRKDGIQSERFYNNAWKSCTYKNEMYGLPWNMSNAALFYNKALMREVGLDPEQPPTTIEELDRMARHMFRKDSTGCYTHVGFIPWFGAGNLYLSSLLWGGSWEAEGQLTPSDPSIIQSLSWMKSYADQYDMNQLQAFIDGLHTEANPYARFGFVFLGCWDMWSIYPRYADADDDWGIAPLPTINGTKPVTSHGGFSFVIPRGSASPDAAWEFIKYASYGKGLEDWVKVDPESNFAAVNETNLEKHPLASDPKFRVFMDLIPSSNPQPIHPYFPYMWSELFRITEKALAGNGSPKELLEQLQKDLLIRSKASEAV